MNEDSFDYFDYAHAMIDQGNLEAIKKIVARRGAFFTRHCFQYALQNGCTLVAYWFLDPSNHRRGARLDLAMTSAGHQQSDLDLWDTMVARFWKQENKWCIWHRYRKMKQIHPRLLIVFLERGVINTEKIWEWITDLRLTSRRRDDSVERLSIIASSASIIASMANWSDQVMIYHLIIEIAHVLSRRFPSKTIGCLLSLMVDVHIREEVIFCTLVRMKHPMPGAQGLISLLEKHQVDLFARDYWMLVDHSPALFPFFHERCQGTSFQVWRGEKMACVISLHSLEIPSCSYFQLDHMHVYTKTITIIREDPVGKLVPKQPDDSTIDPLDQTTTNYQVILQQDDPLESFLVYLPDFLLAATQQAQPRIKSARSIDVAHET